MKVFVFEHFNGALLPEEAGAQSDPLLRQGGAMLRAVADDFLALGGEVLTMLNTRSPVDRNGLTVIPVEVDTDVGHVFDELAGVADATLVIAPETEGVLVDWLERLADTGATSLGCTPEAANLCGDKLATARHLGIVNVPTPKVYELAAAAEAPLSYPVVVKPHHGAGCDDTFICHGPDELAEFDASEPWIVQRFVPGQPVSCSLIVHGTRLVTLLPGAQIVEGERRLSYLGGRIPLAADLAQRATQLAQDAAAWIPGLHGFVGVDMILGDRPEDDRVIDVNPRLTVSYVALSRLCTTNLAEALLDPEAVPAWSDQTVQFNAAGA